MNSFKSALIISTHLPVTYVFSYAALICNTINLLGGREHAQHWKYRETETPPDSSFREQMV